jgi:hypothetical protein
MPDFYAILPLNYNPDLNDLILMRTKTLCVPSIWTFNVGGMVLANASQGRLASHVSLHMKMILDLFTLLETFIKEFRA